MAWPRTDRASRRSSLMPCSRASFRRVRHSIRSSSISTRECNPASREVSMSPVMASVISSVVDIHPHIVSPDTKRYPLAPLGGTQSTWSSERPTTYETLLKAMDDAGIAKAAIVHSSTAYGYDNSYVADAVAAVPSRFTGVYSIDVRAPDAVKRFDYWLGRGCTGMRLFTTGSTLPDQATWFADPKTYPFWEHAAAKSIPVCMQMKQEGLPLLRQIMDKFPTVTMLLAHLSRAPFEDGPPYRQAAELLALADYK